MIIRKTFRAIGYYGSFPESSPNLNNFTVLANEWYDLIKAGEKTVEYREAGAYWMNRLKGKKEVVFRRGYTKTTLKARIKRIAQKVVNGANVLAIHFELIGGVQSVEKELIR